MSTRQVGRFLLGYKQFAVAVAALIIALVLQLLGQATIAHWLLGIISLVATLPLLKGMWDDMRSGAYGIDILAITAIVTSVIMREYWAAIVIVVMLTGGEALEDYAEHRAKTELDALLTRAPQKATIMRGRKTVTVPVHEVALGDKVILKPGEVVPVDAVILEGTGNFDESAITGESLPESKSKDDDILSGSINLDGSVVARCVHIAKESQYEQIVKLVKAASNSQAPFVRLADRYSIPFTIISYAIAIAAWVISGESIRFLEVIVVATPCPLLLAAPIAIISGMSRSAKHGIIVKTGGALERLAQAKTIAFDKTGTLTLGQLQTEKVTAFKPFMKDAVLRVAASLEQHSNHVLAQAITNEAARQKIKTTKAKQLKETAGRGLYALVDGKPALAGRLSFLADQGVALPKTLPELAQTAMYIAIDGKLAGVITFKDAIRPESRRTVSALQKLGFSNIMMVTGDHKASARAIAKLVGIRPGAVTAEALPADKLRVVEQVADRPVAFVGDGVNDAPVLTAAEVGIALGARGSTVASESADVVIMLDEVSRVATAAEIAKRTFRIARQSILIGIFISIGLMLIFSTGHFSPLAGALLQEVVDVVVIFNALRAHGAFSGTPTTLEATEAA